MEVRALVRRNNTNSSEQPLYPMSVVNDSFQRHLEARAIDHGRAPKPENAQDAHYTQKMYASLCMYVCLLFVCVCVFACVGVSECVWALCNFQTSTMRFPLDLLAQNLNGHSQRVCIYTLTRSPSLAPSLCLSRSGTCPMSARGRTSLPTAATSACKPWPSNRAPTGGQAGNLMLTLLVLTQVVLLVLGTLLLLLLRRRRRCHTTRVAMQAGRLLRRPGSCTMRSRDSRYTHRGITIRSAKAERALT